MTLPPEKLDALNNALVTRRKRAQQRTTLRTDRKRAQQTATAKAAPQRLIEMAQVLSKRRQEMQQNAY